MWERRFLLVLVVLLATPVLPRRGSSGGGWQQQRGQGAARGSVGQPNQGGFHPPPNQGGFHPPPNQGGFHPPPNQGGYHPKGGYNPQGGYHPNQGGFRGGTGLGSASRSGAFKTALIGGALGAVGGLVAFEAGKAIIQSVTKPFNYGGHDYYWDNHYQPKSNEIICSMPLSQLQQLTPVTSTTTLPTPTAGETATSTTPQTDQILNNLQFADGTRPKQITWACRKSVEVCCGTDCCPAPSNSAAGGGSGGSGIVRNMAGFAIGLLLLAVLTCCCCGFLAYKFCRSAFQGILPQGGNKQDDGFPGEYSHQYPMQNYPPQAYPQSQGYPTNPNYPQGYVQGYPQSYPSHPTY